jgi:hypothetical protein
MRRLLRFFFSVLICLAPFLPAVPFVTAQNATESKTEFQPNPTSNDVVGARLIVWSEFQKPKPLVDGTQPGEAAKSEQQIEQAAKAVSTPQNRRPEAVPQPADSHSSSSNKVEPAGR